VGAFLHFYGNLRFLIIVNFFTSATLSFGNSLLDVNEHIRFAYP